MIITFAGHSKLTAREALKERLTSTLLSLLPKEEKISFFCGGYGDFDALCAEVCRAIASARDHCEVLLITPYITESHQKRLKEIQKSDLYDGTLYPPLERVPPRLAILKRNEWMVEASDLVIAFVTHTFGGAYKTVAYARKKKKRVINLAEPPPPSEVRVKEE